MQSPSAYPISITEIYRARQAVYQQLKPTALIHYPALSQALGMTLYVKHENHLPGGSFKLRGGVNLMGQLKAAGCRGVITFSTGNHGVSVAMSARWAGVPATVVVPATAAQAKKDAICQAGATLIEAGTTFEQAAARVEQLVADQGLYYVHPANEPYLINGVGTGFLEVVEALPELDALIVPIGAGSEAAAAATVLQALKPEVELYAVQAEASSAARDSWRAGELLSGENRTFAGGFATGQAYALPFEIYAPALKDFICLGEAEIYQGIALAAYYCHNLVEGAGGSTLMAAWKLRHQLKGKHVVLQMSGCNATPEELTQAMALESFRSGLPG